MAGESSSFGSWAVDAVRGNTLASVAVVVLGFPLACFALPFLLPLGLAYYVLVQQNILPNWVPASLLHTEGRGEETAAKPKAPQTATATAKPAAAAVKPTPRAAPKPAAVASGGSDRPITGGVALLRRMREQKAKQAKLENPLQVLVAYASQTGTAQEIAKGVHALIVERTGSSKMCALAPFNDVDINTLKPDKYPLVAFVAASTGDGDPPDNTASFYAKMLRKRDMELRGVKYTSLGLGDSNYTRFMAVPRNIRKKFDGLGAENIYWNAEADEVDGLEETVEKWTEGAVSAILKEYEAITKGKGGGGGGKGGSGEAKATMESKYSGLPPLLPRRVTFSWKTATNAEAGTRRQALSNGEKGAYTSANPFYAKIKSVERVTPADYEKQIIHMELDISGSGMAYKPGDAFGVLPENSPELVEVILGRIGAEGDKVFETSAPINAMASPCSIRTALSRYCDLTSPTKKSLLRMLASHCSADADKAKLLEMISSSGREIYKKQVTEGQPSLLDLLVDYPSCKPPIEDLLEFLPALAPREYSVSSAQEVHTDEIHFAFSVVEYETPLKRIRRGVATSWLSKLADRVAKEGGGGVEIPIFLRPSKDFRHPETISKPMVMIGPGTGVSPFRGFAHYREYLQAQPEASGLQEIGETWLFYGCRNREIDFLYERDFTRLRDAKVLHRYETAFSREQEKKVYVQNKMEANKEALGDLILRKGAFVFVCGDGAHMAKDVHQKLNDILCSTDEEMTPSAADKYLQEMQKGGRYVRDIWS